MKNKDFYDSCIDVHAAFPSRITPCLPLTVLVSRRKCFCRPASVSSENDSVACEIAFAPVARRAPAAPSFSIIIGTCRYPTGFSLGLPHRIASDFGLCYYLQTLTKLMIVIG
ncbi:hypothetical protein SMDB11_1277 [Serratia marcescens subsp. marcescens Db11]|uniref:Uncharacterized protein n=1 Tax=Serratia marcescens subsp. marcescens Db11 TaxID=273526 RepID=A0ABC9IGV1_SERMA|nr:hypothetical protein SMDB11_1277 [Serratia marcescens subsp. marcescens Db11]